VGLAAWLPWVQMTACPLCVPAAARHMALVQLLLMGSGMLLARLVLACQGRRLAMDYPREQPYEAH